MYPRSTSVLISSTCTLSPTSRPRSPVTSLPSTGGSRSRTHVPLSDAPVTMASKRCPIRDSSKRAAADFRSRRSTFSASSSFSVQWLARYFSSSGWYGVDAPASAALTSRWVIRSGKRRLGAVEWVYPSQQARNVQERHPSIGLARIIHDGSSRNRAVALRDGHAEP